MTFAEADEATIAAIVSTAADVVRLIGPRGGFRLLSFRYVDTQGVIVHVGTSIREEADALEQLFAQHGIRINEERLPPAKRKGKC